MSVTLDVPAVRAGEAIEIGVGLTPASVMVDSIHRVSGTSEQMDGRVETLSPSPPALRVAGRPIVVTADTRIVQNGGSVTFAAIGIGMRVSARGSTSGGALSAASIEIRDADADQPISVHGQVANFSGGEQAFAFEIGGRLIRGDQSTRFIEGSRFEGLASGVRAEVNARQQDGFLHAVEIKIE